MRSLNRTMLIGNLGGDPELRYGTGGQAQVTFSLATSYSVKKGEEWEEQTEWHRVVQWGPRAEKTAEWFRKGSKVFVDGRNQTRNYEKDGIKHYMTEVIANDIIGMETRSQQQGAGEFSGAPSTQSASARSGGYVPNEDDLSDLPF